MHHSCRPETIDKRVILNYYSEHKRATASKISYVFKTSVRTITKILNSNNIKVFKITKDTIRIGTSLKG